MSIKSSVDRVTVTFSKPLEEFPQKTPHKGAESTEDACLYELGLPFLPSNFSFLFFFSTFPPHSLLPIPRHIENLSKMYYIISMAKLEYTFKNDLLFKKLFVSRPDLLKTN